MKNLFILAAVVLAGCASSGPVQVGNNTYMITKRSAGGIFTTGVVVKGDIIKEANEFCGKSGKQIDLLSGYSKNAIPFSSMPSAEITFKCVQVNGVQKNDEATGESHASPKHSMREEI